MEMKMMMMFAFISLSWLLSELMILEFFTLFISQSEICWFALLLFSFCNFISFGFHVLLLLFCVILLSMF